MKAFANIKSRYAEYKALDSADKVKAWKEGLINNAIYLLIIIAVIYPYTQNSRFLSVASIVNIISLSADRNRSRRYCWMGKWILRSEIPLTSIHCNTGNTADCIRNSSDVHYAER